jgi:hypothetical protein
MHFDELSSPCPGSIESGLAKGCEVVYRSAAFDLYSANNWVFTPTQLKTRTVLIETCYARFYRKIAIALCHYGIQSITCVSLPTSASITSRLDDAPTNTPKKALSPKHYTGACNGRSFEMFGQFLIMSPLIEAERDILS